MFSIFPYLQSVWSLVRESWNCQLLEKLDQRHARCQTGLNLCWKLEKRSMETQAKASRCPIKRPALAEKQARTQSSPGERQSGEARTTKAPSMPKPVDLLTGSSPQMQHFDSLQ